MLQTSQSCVSSRNVIFNITVLPTFKSNDLEDTLATYGYQDSDWCMQSAGNKSAEELRISVLPPGKCLLSNLPENTLLCGFQTLNPKAFKIYSSEDLEYNS